MKKIIFLFTIGLFTTCSAVNSQESCPSNREITSQYIIRKIKKQKSFYVIYAERNDSTFKIISNIVDTSISNCSKIKRGNTYFLDLETIFPIDSLLGKAIAPNLGIKGLTVSADGEIVMLEKKAHNKIYRALNLNGLYIKDNHSFM